MRNHHRQYRPYATSRKNRHQRRNRRQSSHHQRYNKRLNIRFMPLRDLSPINIFLIVAGVVYYLIAILN